MLSVKELVGNIKSAYSNCESYEDSGIASLVIEDESGSRCISRCAFETKAEPPGRFHYEFRDELMEWDTLNFVDFHDEIGSSNLFEWKPGMDLLSCVSRIHGISKGGAGMISTLLFPQLKDMLKQRVVDRQFSEVTIKKIGEEDCYFLHVNASEWLACSTKDFLIKVANFRVMEGSDKFTLIEFSRVVLTRREPFAVI